jgi:hypothetical protein
MAIDETIKPVSEWHSVRGFHQLTPKQMERRRKGESLMEKVFPTILMALDFIAAVPYAFKGDVKMFVYWIAAGVLTLAVTYL